MRFDPELTQRVRDLILARGAGTPPRTDLELAGMGQDGTPEREAIVERVAPMAEALFLVMSADGVCVGAERTALRGAILTVTDGELDGRVVDSLLGGFDRALDQEGHDARLDTVAAQLSGDRADGEVAVELAAAVITSDGDVHPAERAALERLAEDLGIDPDRALELLG